MKKLVVLLLSFALLLGLCACGGNGLFKSASPTTSALRFVWFDGTSGSSGWLFAPAREQNILNDLSKVKATPAGNWSPDKITYPIYGLSIGGYNVPGVQAAWSNGYLILQDGSTYHFNYDFSRLQKDYEWDNTEKISSLTYFPCHYYLAKHDNQWVVEHLAPADQKQPPEGITMDLASVENNLVTVTLINRTTTEWMYGESFSLEVLLDGTWYDVPVEPSQNWAFPSIGLLLSAGGTQEKSYSLAMYGNLPSGTYRLVVEELTTEFAL